MSFAFVTVVCGISGSEAGVELFFSFLTESANTVFQDRGLPGGDEDSSSADDESFEDSGRASVTTFSAANRRPSAAENVLLLNTVPRFVLGEEICSIPGIKNVESEVFIASLISDRSSASLKVLPLCL